MLFEAPDDVIASVEGFFPVRIDEVGDLVLAASVSRFSIGLVVRRPFVFAKSPPSIRRR